MLFSIEYFLVAPKVAPILWTPLHNLPGFFFTVCRQNNLDTRLCKPWWHEKPLGKFNSSKGFFLALLAGGGWNGGDFGCSRAHFRAQENAPLNCNKILCLVCNLSSKAHRNGRDSQLLDDLSSRRIDPNRRDVGFSRLMAKRLAPSGRF